jgi:hypothetical protein
MPAFVMSIGYQIQGIELGGSGCMLSSTLRL